MLADLCQILLILTRRAATAARTSLLSHQRRPAVIALVLCILMLACSLRATPHMETAVYVDGGRSDSSTIGAAQLAIAQLSGGEDTSGGGHRGGGGGEAGRVTAMRRRWPEQKTPTDEKQEQEARRLPVTIRSMHNGRYWQVLGEGTTAGPRLSASAAPQERGLERTVFLLERDGGDEGNGWVTLRWLKTRQLVEALPPGVAGREDDAWRVGLSRAQSVSELHKLIIEDDAAHRQSYVWSTALKGYLNALEQSGEVVGHGDALPPASATEPPARGAVIVERLDGGAVRSAVRCCCQC